MFQQAQSWSSKAQTIRVGAYPGENELVKNPIDVHAEIVLQPLPAAIWAQWARVVAYCWPVSGAKKTCKNECKDFKTYFPSPPPAWGGVGGIVMFPEISFEIIT